MNRGNKIQIYHKSYVFLPRFWAAENDFAASKMQCTANNTYIEDTWTKQVPCESSLLSAAANQTQEGLRLQGSRLLANFNESITLDIPVASRDVCELALSEKNPSHWYKKFFGLFHARGLAH